MPGGSVYKDHTFNKETAQYVHVTNFHSTIQYIYISTIQVHEHYKTQETEHTEKNTENTNIVPGNEPGPSSL
jgi:hypothetical protein